MRRIVLGLGAALLAACAKPDAPPAEPAAPPAPAPINLADVAGTWTVRSMAEGSDSALVTYTMSATGTTEGWTITLPGRPAMPLVVGVGGDSATTTAGPFESVLRKGVQVTTNGVLRLVDGKLVGTTVAHYMGAGADSVLRMRVEGTRNP